MSRSDVEAAARIERVRIFAAPSARRCPRRRYSLSLPSPPIRVEATSDAVIVSLPSPPMAFSITVSKAMASCSSRPPTLEKVPGVRLIVASSEKPDTSNVLFVPFVHSVMTGFLLTLKS